MGTRVVRCANVHVTPVSRFAMDRGEQVRAFIDIDGKGEELVAIYHSHPITQPYPSPTDRAEWHYPEAFSVLVSLRDATPELRGYRVRDGWVREVGLI